MQKILTVSEIVTYDDNDNAKTTRSNEVAAGRAAYNFLFVILTHKLAEIAAVSR